MKMSRRKSGLQWAAVCFLFVYAYLPLNTAQTPVDDNEGCVCDKDGAELPFAGVTINVLGRSFGDAYFKSKVAEWEQLSGATVNIPYVATSGSELNALAYEDMQTGANFYDGYIATNQNVPTLAHSEMDRESWILKLDTLVKESSNDSLDWPGIHSIFREYLCLYNEHIYTLPFDGDQFFLYYRRDLQERDGWDVPQTWEELIEVAEQYENQDLNGDGVPDYAMCQPNQGDLAFYSLYSPLISLLQTHPKDDSLVRKRIFPQRHGVFFELEEDGLAPLVDNAAMRRVLPLMKRIFELGKSEDIDLCCGTKNEGAETNSGHGLFRTGQCAFYFSFPSVGTNSVIETTNEMNVTEYPFQHGRMGTAELPGWTEYLDRETDTLKPCDLGQCPAAVPLSNDTSRYLNRASWFANGGMGSIINARTTTIKQEAAFDLFSYFSKNLETTQAGVPYNPFRDPEHFNVTDYYEAGWNEEDANEYVITAKSSLANENAAMDLRVPYVINGNNNSRGFFLAYSHHFNEYYRDPSSPTDKVISDLEAEIKDWIAVHDTRVASSETYWTGTIEQIYRRSMSLPLRAPPLEQNYDSLKGVRWVGWSIAIIILVLSLTFALWVFLKRGSRVIRASQPVFLVMICSGTFVMGAALFPLGIDDTIASFRGCDIACMAWPWLLACGFTISFSALFSKQWRINKIFHNARFKRIKVTVIDVIVPFLTMMTLNVVFLTAWTIIDPLRWEIVQEDLLNSYGRCAPKGDGTAAAVFMVLIAVVNASALALANVQAYRARMISDEFSESKYIGLAMFAMMEVLLFAVPISFLVYDTPSARFMVFSGIVFAITLSLLLLIFVPKLKLVRNLAMNAGASSRPTRSVQLARRRESRGENGIAITTATVTEKTDDYREKLTVLKTMLEQDGVNSYHFFKKAGLHAEVEFDETDPGDHYRGSSVSFADDQFIDENSQMEENGQTEETGQTGAEEVQQNETTPEKLGSTGTDVQETQKLAPTGMDVQETQKGTTEERSEAPHSVEAGESV